jgi:aminoglycoside 3-N-acetyltransferase
MIVTKDNIISGLIKLNVQKGDRLICHVSLSSLGWVVGGSPSIVDALCDVVTKDGIIMFPTHTGHYSDPKFWENPPVPEEWYNIIYEHMPPFRSDITPCRSTIGKVAETFRNYPNACRSSHPVRSVSAMGIGAESIVSIHTYDFPHGKNSPIHKMFQKNAKILLLGVSNMKNTSLHLCEYLSELSQDIRIQKAPILNNQGERELITYKDIKYKVNAEIREQMMQKYELEYPNLFFQTDIGRAEAKLYDMEHVVDFGTKFINQNFA